ncbi:hypothetical protein BH24ACT1_BH24ACT1_02930 [soil metagenome]
MPLSRLFATGLWLAVTAASTGIVWMATSTVAADVTDRPATVLAHDDVVDELASASSPATTTTSITPEAEGPVSTVPPGDRAPAPANPNPAIPSPTSPAPQRDAIAAPVSPPNTETTEPEPPIATRPASPAPSPTTLRPTTTYSTSGGVVRVACNGVFIDLVSAIPNNGYAVNVVAGGPGNVDVHFVGRGQDLSVKAVCFGQPIRYYDQSPPPRQAWRPS